MLDVLTIPAVTGDAMTWLRPFGPSLLARSNNPRGTRIHSKTLSSYCP